MITTGTALSLYAHRPRERFYKIMGVDGGRGMNLKEWRELMDKTREGGMDTKEWVARLEEADAALGKLWRFKGNRKRVKVVREVLRDCETTIRQVELMRQEAQGMNDKAFALSLDVEKLEKRIKTLSEENTFLTVNLGLLERMLFKALRESNPR